MTARTATYRFTVSAAAPSDPEKRHPLLWPDHMPVPDHVAQFGTLVADYVEKRRQRGHQDRMKTAGALLLLTLDPERCEFKPGRVSLTGELEADSPDQATDTVLTLLRWTLAQVFRDGDGDMKHIHPRSLRLNLRETRTRKAHHE